jgi:hypothetical protein
MAQNAWKLIAKRRSFADKPTVHQWKHPPLLMLWTALRTPVQPVWLKESEESIGTSSYDWIEKSAFQVHGIAAGRVRIAFVRRIPIQIAAILAASLA